MDRVVQYRVMSIILGMGLHSPVSLVDDFDPDFSIKNCGLYRLYEFHLEIREDVDLEDFITDFCNLMHQYNAISYVKTDLYEATEYPGPAKNWITVYLTVAVI